MGSGRSRGSDSEQFAAKMFDKKNEDKFDIRSSAGISEHTAKTRKANPLEKIHVKKLIDDGHIKSYKSQLSINKAFASNEFAQRFCVCNPRQADGRDHIVYTVYGEDS